MPERVLIIDDDRGVRDAFRRVLEKAGFEVETASNGREGLGATSGEPLDAIICDIKMPSLSGLGVHTVLHELFPTLAGRMIFVTAYREDPHIQAFLANTGQPVLDKPVDIAALVKAVRDISKPPQ